MSFRTDFREDRSRLKSTPEPSPWAIASATFMPASSQQTKNRVRALCVVETPVSDYVRSFLSHPIHEKYTMDSPLCLNRRNFVGAEYVLDLHQLTVDLCRESFGASYADPRPLSGTSAVTNLLMTLSEPGQRTLLQTYARASFGGGAPRRDHGSRSLLALPQRAS